MVSALMGKGESPAGALDPLANAHKSGQAFKVE